MKKIINDPVHGFITVNSERVMEVIDHRYFQRLRRIKQLGLTEMVYPGALHTRFHHALGAMHLMSMAMGTLCDRGHSISSHECEAAMLAILLHDVGHGPFSHALEKSILTGVGHEEVSHFIMQRMAAELGGPLTLSERMFSGTYPRPFFNYLVSSQLDCDRLDYLKRDCFFTGVLEGAIGAGRLIKMLDIEDEQIVVEEKGIYSVENFLNSRRVMYWQVYLHKTTVCAEEMLIRLIRRARQLIAAGEKVWTPEWLGYFFQHEVTLADFERDPEVAECFMMLDDNDIWQCIKCWMRHPDLILSKLATALWERKLFRVRLQPEPPAHDWQHRAERRLMDKYGITREETQYFLIQGTVSNAAYQPEAPPINIRMRTGEVVEITKASDLPHIAAMAQTVEKHYICWPKEVEL